MSFSPIEMITTSTARQFKVSAASWTCPRFPTQLPRHLNARIVARAGSSRCTHGVESERGTFNRLDRYPSTDVRSAACASRHDQSTAAQLDPAQCQRGRLERAKRDVAARMVASVGSMGRGSHRHFDGGRSLASTDSAAPFM
jgi:hypothetical protein